MTPAHAIPLEFTFSFENVDNGGGLVTGIIRGLEDGQTQAALSVEILTNGNPAFVFGLGEYVGNPTFNLFTVVGGQLTQFNFLSQGRFNSAPAVTGATFNMNNVGSPGSLGVGLSLGARGFSAATAGSQLTIRATPVDEPAILILLAAGRLVLRWSRKRKIPAHRS